MKKITIFLFIIIIFAYNIYADSFTFSSQINGISTGYSGFGFGLFPFTTSFSYYKSDLELIPSYRHKAELYFSSNFNFSNPYIDSNYVYDTGHPRWNMTRKEAQGHAFLSGVYLNPSSYIDVYLSQEFGTNPVSNTDSLFSLTIGNIVYYNKALEGFNKSFGNMDYTFVDGDGNPKPPFDGRYINAFPWLSGDREIYNYVYYSSLNFNFHEKTGMDAYDGLRLGFYFEAGPSWYLNVNDSGLMSDYWYFSTYLEERLTLYYEKQSNDWNWLTIYIGHRNNYSYVGGDVVPKNRIPSNRLRASLSDRLYLHFGFAQFLVADSYSYFDLSLSNTLNFGRVVNERDQSSEAYELVSSIGGYYHLRLFGFMIFEYSINYRLFGGIWDYLPGWSHQATVTFKVTI